MTAITTLSSFHRASICPLSSVIYLKSSAKLDFTHKKKPHYKVGLFALFQAIFGAGKEIRTLDPNLGKVMLYH